jgi:hypothetical protein
MKIAWGEGGRRARAGLTEGCPSSVTPVGNPIGTYDKRGEASLERLVIGYASGPGRGAVAREELEQQAAVIAQECKRRRLRLVELVNEREPTKSPTG